MHNALRYGKTAISWSVVVSVIAWSMGLAALLAPLSSVHALASGDLIKASQAAVYYYGADGKRYVFPNEKTYSTWYADFSGVITITDAELAAIPIGGNATYKPGVKMVKITTDPKVYAVNKNGGLRWVTSETVATDLYGANWNTMIEDVPDAFFVNYTTGTDINNASEFDKAAVEAAATSINDDKDLTAGGDVGGGDVVASLAADTPVSNLAVENAARLAFTKVNLTNNTNLDAVVDQVVVERMGLAADASLSSVEILDATTRLPLNKNSRTLGAEHTAIFNDDFTVPAQSTLGVLLAGNMAASNDLRAGEQVILGLKALTLKGGGTVSGTLPVAGNPFTINATLVIGTVTVAAGANNPAAATKEVGTNNYIVTSFRVTAGPAEDIMVKTVTFTQNGSGSPGDVENLELLDANTSTVVCTIAQPETDEVTCNLEQQIEKGKNKTYDLRLDIKDGSARTISYDIDEQADLRVVGELYGYDILPTYPNSATPFFNANNTTIGDGTLNVENLSVTPTNISEGLDQTVVGKFNFVVKGEPMNIERVGWSFTLTTATAGAALSDVTNVTIYDPNGAVVAGPLDPVVNAATAVAGDTAQGTASSTDTFTVPVGDNTYTVKADLSTDFATNDTLRMHVSAASATVKGDVSNNTITPTPTGQTNGTTLTLKAAALNITNSATPAAQTVVSGAANYEAANFVLDATQSGDDIRITSIAIAHKHGTPSFPNLLSGFKVWDGANQVVVDSDSISCQTTGGVATSCNTAAANATTTLTITAGNLNVTKGSSKTLKVTTNIGTGATSGSFEVSCGGCVSAIDSDAQTVTNTYTNAAGQTMTLTSGGTLNVSVLTDPKSDVVVGGSTVEVGRFTMEPKNEGANFNFFGFHINSPDGGIVGSQDELTTLTVEQVGGSSWSVPVDQNRATVTPISLSQGINEEKTYVIKAAFASINDSSPAEAGAGLRINLSNVDASGASGGTTLTENGLGNNFSTFSIFKSIPTVAKIAFSGSDVITGNDIFDLFKLSITADSAGPIGLWKLTFEVSTTTVILDNAGFYLYESDSSTTLGDIIAQGGDIISAANAGDNPKTHARIYLDINNDNGIAIGEHRVLNAGSTKYYTFRGTVASDHDGTADNESLSTRLAGDAAFHGTVGTTTHGIDRRFCSEDDGVCAGTGDPAVNDDFIWSDLNLDLYATTTATEAKMWFNGYRVPGMDDTSSTPQTITD